MRRYLIALILCGIFFLFPFQIYIIGSDVGIGIEGAVYRYQITSYGNTFIPITSDIMFIVNRIYSGRTALSIIIWALGTALLTATTIFGLIYAHDPRLDYIRQLSIGLLGTCSCYLISCIAQYGFFFSSPAGISLPAGILIMISWIIVINGFHDNFFNRRSL